MVYTSKYTGMKHTIDSLQPVVQNSFSVAEVLRKLGMIANGGTHSYVSRRIKQLGIDTSHFSGIAWRKGKIANNRLGWQQILVVKPIGYKEKTSKLRRALIESGRPHCCEECGQGDEWNSKPLVLQIDHKNTKTNDNRPSNVRFLCPNCHTQTETYGKTKTRPARRCQCGVKIKSSRNKSGICQTCRLTTNPMRSQ